MIIRKLSWLVLPVLVLLLPMSNALAALCGDDLDLNNLSTVFTGAGQCASTGEVQVAAGGPVEYDYGFSIAADSGITRLNISGYQSENVKTLQILELVGGEWEARHSVKKGQDITGFFDVLAGGSYILNVTGLEAGNGTGFYNIALTAVPLPAAVWLFGGGLFSLMIMGRKRKQSAELQS
ncbi:hypothetical protein A9Q89_04820 [Gammaproteobacteria bacterium 53_120_T64]|nr:hypothetical protein A9Q89_04820 [Gammaproteobacteria bacterium 53_120_T64]